MSFSQHTKILGSFSETTTANNNSNKNVHKYITSAQTKLLTKLTSSSGSATTIVANTNTITRPNITDFRLPKLFNLVARDRNHPVFCSCCCCCCCSKSPDCGLFRENDPRDLNSAPLSLIIDYVYCFMNDTVIGPSSRYAASNKNDGLPVCCDVCFDFCIFEMMYPKHLRINSLPFPLLDTWQRQSGFYLLGILEAFRNHCVWFDLSSRYRLIIYECIEQAVFGSSLLHLR